MKRLILVVICSVVFVLALVGLYYVLPFGDGAEATRHRAVTTSIVGGLILVVTVVLLLKTLLRSSASERSAAGPPDQGSSDEKERSERLAALTRSFDRAMAELVNNCHRWPRRLRATYAQPWILVMGPSGAGKSVALRGSGLHSPGARSVQGFGGTTACDWWMTSDAVFLDTAGSFTRGEHARTEWLELLRLLVLHRRRRPVDALMVVVALDQVMSLDRRGLEDMACTLRERVIEAYVRLNARPPVLLVFSKVDLIEGFFDCFSGLSEEEKEKPWGFVLTGQYKTARAQEASLEAAFTRMSEHLRTWLLGKLLADAPRASREGVFLLPGRFEDIASVLVRFTSMLVEPIAREALCLQGVFLVGSGEKGEELPGQDEVDVRFCVTTAQRAAGVREEERRGPYFARRLFRDVLLKQLTARHLGSARQRLARRCQWAFTLLVFASVAFTSALTAVEHDRLRIQVNRTRRAVATDHWPRGTHEKPDPIAELKHLEDLGSSVAALEDSRVRPGTFDLMSNQVTQLYERQLTEVLLKPTTSYLEHRLEDAAMWSPGQDTEDLHLFEHYYSSLETYLTLSGACRRPDKHLGDRMEEAWEAANGLRGEAGGGPVFRALEGRLGQGRMAYISVDDGLLERVRNQLQQADLTIRDYRQTISSVEPGAPRPLRLRATTISVSPSLYSVASCKAFRKALEKKALPERHDCVLAMDIPPELRDKDALWRHYEHEYGRAWQEWLASWQLVAEPLSMQQVIGQLSDLADPQESEIVKVYKVLGGPEAEESSLLGGVRIPRSLMGEKDPCETLAERFAGYWLVESENQPMPQKLDESITSLVGSLNLLKLRLIALEEAREAGQPVLDFMVDTMNGTSELVQASRALQQFKDAAISGESSGIEAAYGIVREVLEDSWQLLQGEGTAVLQKRWDSDVVPAWQALAEKYPFEQNAGQVASCQQIDAVIGTTNSALSQYVITELGPFVKEPNAAKLQVRSGVFGATLPLSHDFIQAVRTVREIYLQGECVSEPPSQLIPTLEAGSRSLTVSSVRFECGGSAACYRMSSRVSKTCISAGSGVGLVVTVGGGAVATEVLLNRFDGPWAFERFLESSSRRFGKGSVYAWKAEGEQRLEVGSDTEVWLRFPSEALEGRLKLDDLRKLRLPQRIFEVSD